MNRLLRNIFFALAILSAAYAAAFANYLHSNEQSVLRSKMVWLAVCGAIFLLWAGWKFPVKIRFKVFAVLLCLFLLEFLLQATAWLGILPAVETKLKAPYARVYWTAEGRGNGIRNRFGWYFPEFNLQAAHKIVYIGDSQVEAVEVSRSQNQAADLRTLLEKRFPDWTVLGLGNHGSCVAHSIDVLDYAWRHFQPQEAIVAVSIGSDVTEASSKLNYTPADQYIYYDLDPTGKLALDPSSKSGRAGFDRSLEMSHESPLTLLPVILNSHCMTLQLFDSLRDRFYTKRRVAQLVASGDDPNGFNPAPFATHPSPEAQHAMQLLLAELQQCKNICDSHGMKLRVVTIPTFPKAFYDTQTGTNWTMRIDGYDYFGPEREVVNWANADGVPIVSIGATIEKQKIPVNQIRTLYFSNGSGHLTPKGHMLIAQTVFDTFYNDKKK